MGNRISQGSGKNYRYAVKITDFGGVIESALCYSVDGGETDTCKSGKFPNYRPCNPLQIRKLQRCVIFVTISAWRRLFERPPVGSRFSRPPPRGNGLGSLSPVLPQTFPGSPKGKFSPFKFFYFCSFDFCFLKSRKTILD